MADVRGVTGVSAVTRPDADDAFHYLRTQRDGALFTSDWVMGLAMEGRVYVANAGTLSAPITFSASNTIIGTENDLDVSVPAGTLVIPLEIRLNMESFGSTLQFQAMAMVGTGGAADSGTTLTPTNLRTDAPNASVSTIVAAGGASATAQTTNLSEFWRVGTQFAADKTSASATTDQQDDNELHIWRHTDNAAPPIMYSSSVASRLSVHVASESGTGFIVFTYAELPGAAIS